MLNKYDAPEISNARLNGGLIIFEELKQEVNEIIEYVKKDNMIYFNIKPELIQKLQELIK